MIENFLPHGTGKKTNLRLDLCFSVFTKNYKYIYFHRLNNA